MKSESNVKRVIIIISFLSILTIKLIVYLA